jgi:amidase
VCGPGTPQTTPPPEDRRESLDRVLAADRTGLFFDREVEPVMEVEPDTALVVETLDCAAGLIRSSADVIPHIDDLVDRLGGLNFVTGPIRVAGVEQGDVLRVSILDIEPAPRAGHGFIAIAPGFGTLVGDGEELAPVTTICAVDRHHVTIPLTSGPVRLPCVPFVGTIGVAPVRERRMTLSQGIDYVGDIDLPQFRAGSTLHIRANHPGGLLSLGDVHAAQGDGEFGGFAVEVDARVTISIAVTPRARSPLGRLPVLADAEAVGVVSASQGTPTTEAVRAGARELAGLLVRSGMERSDALQYLSAAARVRLGNMFEPFYSAYVYVERATLPVQLPPELAGPGRESVASDAN